MSTGPAYFTILAGNYFPKSITLAGSLAKHHPGSSLYVLFIDIRNDDDLPQVPGLVSLSTASLGLTEREVLRLATIYDLVEFATAVKPMLFKQLLKDHEQAIYLDPDTYLTAAMVELLPDLAATEGGILLTPHFLEPIPATADLTEGHLLTVGVYNLGFCAVDRRAADFLDWWWGHLQNECIWDPLSGLFVDQKWVDIGSTLFRAGAWRHYGYNVSVANLHERPLAVDDAGYYIASSGDRLRLFHFHAFDTSAPEELSTRTDRSTAHLRSDSVAVDALCNEYAEILIQHEQTWLPAVPYPYFHDTAGRPISRHLRRVYRSASAPADELPSPFLSSDAQAWSAWRRKARKSEARELLADGAKSLRLIFPEEYGRARQRFPKLAGRLRSRFIRSSGIWG
jgi:hypothetical protein